MNFYDIYTKSPEWKIKREQRLEKDNHKCRTCENIEGFPVQVHHKTYINLGNEPMEDLITVCTACHDALTDRIRRGRYTERGTPDLQDTAVISIALPRRGEGNGVSRIDIQDSRCVSVVMPQRTACRPDEPIFQSDQAHIRKTEEN